MSVEIQEVGGFLEEADDLSGGTAFAYQKPIIPSGKLPPARGGATIVCADGKLVAFGGHYYAGNDKFTYLDETWLLDTERLVWHHIKCSGEIPGKRYGHTAHLLGSRMFIFGGKGPGNEYYKDVYFLDLVEWVWVAVSTISQGPSPRFYHAAEVVGRKIVVHGGWDGADVFDDLWIFNTDSFAWMQPKTAGFAPTPRYGHSLTLTPDGRLMLFGGVSLDKTASLPRYNDDVRQLDTDSMIWTRPRVNGSTPTGRFGHSATLMDNGCIVVFGGWGRGGCQCKESVSDPKAHSLQVLDTATMTWWVPRRVGKKVPRHLHNHGAARAGSAVFMFGGCDGRQAVNEFVVLNVELS